MSALINGLDGDGIVSVSRVILRSGFSVDELELGVAEMCENVNINSM